MHEGYIWLAVSSSSQVRNVSLDSQLTSALQFADRFNTHITGALVVPGRSRYIGLFHRAAEEVDGLHLTGNAIKYAADGGVENIVERVSNGEVVPGVEKVFVYAKLLELVEARKFNVLFFLNRSRIGRKAALSITVADLCAENGVKLFDMESPPSSLDVSVSHDDQLIGAVKSVGFERDIRDLIAKTSAGLKRRVEKGLFVNRVPWGYRRLFDSAGNVTGYELDPTVKAVVETFIQMYLDGYGKESISDELQRRGMPAPTSGGWNPEKVRGLLDKVWAYAGYAEINRRSLSGRQYFRTKGIWEPVIDEETARRVVAEKESRIHKPKAISHCYLFSRCVVCAHCGRNMGAKRTMWRAKKGSQTVGWRHQYRCNNHGFVSEKKIIRAMQAFLRQLEDDTFRQALSQSSAASDTDSINDQIATLNRDIERRRAGIAKADDDYYMHGTLEEDRHRTIVSTAKKAIETMLVQITRLTDQLSDLERDSQRHERVDKVHMVGLERLADSNVRRANAWLREHFRIYVTEHEVSDIIIL